MVHLNTAAGSSLIPWVLSVSKPDALHILPVAAGILQGLSGFTVQNKNIIMFALPVALGLVVLWKAPAALSVYWGVNSILNFVEKKILSLEAVKQRFFNVASAEEMISSVK